MQFSLLIYIVVIFAVMYFLMIRPQQKRAKQHRELINY
ncbi:preprotein translocase subunit YajC, partial [Enterococcus faecalis]